MQPSVDAMEGQRTIAQCAVHEGAQSTGTCTRCGNFVCPLCLDTDSAFADVCARCRERLADAQLPWEHPDVHVTVRYVRTIGAIFARSPGILERAPIGPAMAGLTFAAFHSLVLGALIAGLALIAAFVAPRESGALLCICVVPFVTAVAGLLGTLLFGLLYEVGVAIVGGRGGIETSLWICGYLQPIYTATLFANLLTAIPYAGPVIVLVAHLALVVWIGAILHRVGKAMHQLSTARAAFAATFPFVVLIGVGIVLAVLAR